MDKLLARFNQPQLDAGLLFLRLSGAFMLFHVHGWPKIVHYSDELTRIEDPFGMGATFSLVMAIFAEVVCPLLIALGLLTRLACLPIIAVLLVAMLVVHTQWSIAEGQFGWLLLSIFGALAFTGPGNWSLAAALGKKDWA